MTKAPEIRRLPRYVDAIRLCQQGVALEGWLAICDLPRLVAALPAGLEAETLQVTWQFGIDGEGHRVLTGRFDIELAVICQRCLEVMDYPVRAEFYCSPVASDEQAKILPAHLEPVMVEGESGRVALYDLLEDELLLNLPIAALHDRCEQEGANGNTSSLNDEADTEAEASKKPFAALAGLFDRQSLKKE